MDNHYEENSKQIQIPPTIKYRPLPAELEKATDHNAPSVIMTVDAPGNYPCRRCLQDGKVGEKVRLLSYDPWLADSPYRQYGPIFVHEEPRCQKAEFLEGSFLPEQQQKRALSVRAFNNDHMMVGFDTIEGNDLISRAEKFFEQKGDDHAEYIHVHYPGPGCFAVRVERETQRE